MCSISCCIHIKAPKCDLELLIMLRSCHTINHSFCAVLAADCSRSVPPGNTSMPRKPSSLWLYCRGWTFSHAGVAFRWVPFCQHRPQQLPRGAGACFSLESLEPARCARVMAAEWGCHMGLVLLLSEGWRGWSHAHVVLVQTCPCCLVALFMFEQRSC